MSFTYPDNEYVVITLLMYPLLYQPYRNEPYGRGPMFHTREEAQAWCDEKNLENCVAAGDAI